MPRDEENKDNNNIRSKNTLTRKLRSMYVPTFLQHPQRQLKQFSFTNKFKHFIQEREVDFSDPNYYMPCEDYLRLQKYSEQHLIPFLVNHSISTLKFKTGNTKIVQAIVIAIKDGSCALTSLELNYFGRIFPSSEFEKAFSSTLCTLEHFKLSTPLLEDENAYALSCGLARNRSITSLAFEAISINPRDLDLILISIIIKKNLKILKFINTSLDAKHFILMCDIILSPVSVLHSFTYSNADLDTSNCARLSRLAMFILGGTLINPEAKITALDLSNICCHDYDVISILQCVLPKFKVSFLNIRGISLNDDALQDKNILSFFQEALASNFSLRSFDYGYAIPVIDALVKNNLYLSTDNYIKTFALIKQFFDELTSTIILQYIHIDAMLYYSRIEKIAQEKTHEHEQFYNPEIKELEEHLPQNFNTEMEFIRTLQDYFNILLCTPDPLLSLQTNTPPAPYNGKRTIHFSPSASTSSLSSPCTSSSTSEIPMPKNHP